MPFRAKINQPWGWDRKQAKKAAMRVFHIRMHPATMDLIWEVETMYSLYYNRRFDHASALRHAFQNANLNIRKSLATKGIDPEPALAELKIKLARRRSDDEDEVNLPFEGPAPDPGRIDIG